MLKLGYSDILKRKIRKDEPLNELGINTYSRIKEAVRKGDKNETLDLIDYLDMEGKGVHDLYCDWTQADLVYVAEKFGEEEVPKMLENARKGFSKGFYKKLLELPTDELVIWFSETIRGHRGDFSLVEEKDRYVMEFNPCATGGRMRRAIENERKSTGNSELSETGKTKKPYTWSWGKKGVFYYCIHCCLWHEILPIEWRGYPIKIAEYSEDPMAPCYFYFYKDPKLIPDYYFTRVGKKKNPLLFKK